MKTISPINQILNSIESQFSNQYKKIRENISLVAYAILRCQTVNTGEIARYMSEANGLDFKANDMKVYRLLRSNDFQVDDTMWRGYIRLLFGLIEENSIKNSREIVINVDYTSDSDDFLILCASVCIHGQSIPLYFSMRKYHRRPGMYNQKKMEEAFFKALRHLLPQGWSYTVVADRGFGHHRIIEILEKQGFYYVLRFNDDLNVELNNQVTNLKQLPHKNYIYPKVKVITWDHTLSIVKRIKGDQYWLLASNLPQEALGQAGTLYEGRFSIEKMFKNKKSGGFDIEKLQIKKYDRFKRLLFISFISYAILIFTGLFIRNKVHPLKKNYFLSHTLLSAFLPSYEKL